MIKSGLYWMTGYQFRKAVSSVNGKVNGNIYGPNIPINDIENYISGNIKNYTQCYLNEDKSIVNHKQIDLLSIIPGEYYISKKVYRSSLRNNGKVNNLAKLYGPNYKSLDIYITLGSKSSYFIKVNLDSNRTVRSDTIETKRV